MGEIFLSYSRHDHDFADRLTDCLKHQGIGVWVDKQEIQGGESWRETIVRAITDCDAFLVILSPQCVASKNVVKELSLASEKDRHIIPIICEECDIPDGMQYQLAEQQRIDFCELGFDAALQRLVNTLRRGASARAVGNSAAGSCHSSSPPSPLPATQAPAASDPQPFSATTFPFPQPRPQPAVPNIQQLGATLCGRWRVQIIVPGVGPIGELMLDMFPNLAFNGQLMMAVGISSAVSGMWQITPLGQLVLQGQQTVGWTTTPYFAVIQFMQVSPTALAGTSDTGEQVIWTKVA